MAHTELLPGFVLVAVTAAAVLATLLVGALSRPAASRAGLVAGGLPLALLPPLGATAFVAAKAGGYLGGLRSFGPGGQVEAVTASLWQLQSVAWAAFALACLVGLALGFVRAFDAGGAEASSARRSLVLLLLPMLGLLLTTLLTQRVAKGTRVASHALAADWSDAAARTSGEAALAAEGFAAGSSGSLGRLARYVARTTLFGAFGGAACAIVLLGLAAPGFILAWSVRFGSAFRAAAAAIWLLAAAFGALASLGLLRSLRFS